MVVVRFLVWACRVRTGKTASTGTVVNSAVVVSSFGLVLISATVLKISRGRSISPFVAIVKVGFITFFSGSVVSALFSMNSVKGVETRCSRLSVFSILFGSGMCVVDSVSLVTRVTMTGPWITFVMAVCRADLVAFLFRSEAFRGRTSRPLITTYRVRNSFVVGVLKTFRVMGHFTKLSPEVVIFRFSIVVWLKGRLKLWWSIRRVSVKVVSELSVQFLMQLGWTTLVRGEWMKSVRTSVGSVIWTMMLFSACSFVVGIQFACIVRKFVLTIRKTGLPTDKRLNC